MVCNYFDYIMFSAFETLLIYDDKKFLGLDKLLDYFDYMLEYVKCSDKNEESITCDMNFYNSRKEFIDMYKNMSIEDKRKNINKFLSNNKELFYLENSEIYIKSDITIEKLNDLRKEIEVPSSLVSGLVNIAQRKLETIEILGTKKLKKDLLELLKLACYNNLLFSKRENIESRKLIKKGNNIIESKLLKLSNKSTYAFNMVVTYFNQLFEQKYNRSIDSDIRNLNIVSEELKRKDLFYKNNESVLALDLYGIDFGKYLLYILFNDENLCWYKINSQLEFISFLKYDSLELDEYLEEYEEYDDSEFIEDEEYYEEDDNYCDELYEEDYLDESGIDRLETIISTNVTFYLRYIFSIDNYQNKFDYNDSLNNVRTNLLYFLNQGNYKFYDEKNVYKMINSICLDEIDDISYYKEFYILSRLFLYDIVSYENIDENTLKKILFISTYYDLTNDYRIESIIDEFKTTDMGNKVYRAIINHEINLFDMKPNSFTKKIK